MTSLQRLSLLALLGGSALVASAQNAQSGALVGRISDGSNNLSLSGARVTIAALGLETYTDSTGDFSFFYVKPGNYEVEVSYVGFSDLRFVVGVEAGRTTRREASFNEKALTLERFVVQGSEVGAARALNRQRAAASLVNVVAADEIGRFPDQNAAESLQRIPGVALYRDQGEGRFIVARGLNPEYNAVTLNGSPVASPERGSRTLALDVLPTDSLGSVEVHKVLTPDMPAEGLGASVNMKTRSAFDSSERQVSASMQGQYSDLRDTFSGKLNATYADRFADGKLGFIISPTWQKREFGSHNFEEDGGWSLKTVPGTSTQQYFLNGLAFREYEMTRTRYGVNTALEFRPDATARYAVRATYSRFDDAENRYITFIPFSEGSISALTPTSATVTNLRRERHDLRMREKQQWLTALGFESENTLGDWVLTTRAAWSEGREERPDETTVRFRKSAKGSTWTYDFAKGTYSPVVAQTAGSSITDPAVFNENSRLQVVNSPGSEQEWSGGVDVRRNLKWEGVKSSFLKTGVLFRDKTKDQSSEVVDYKATGTSTFTYANLYEAQINYPYFGGQRISADKVTKAFWGNLSAFTPSRNVVDSELEDWESTEKVTAVYGMGSVSWGRNTLTTGVRHEYTKFTNKGNSIADEEDVTAVSASSSHGATLPTAIWRFDLAPGTVVRASIGRTLARPQFEQTAIMRSVNSSDFEITQGNPNLRPLEATNYDFSVEQYYRSLGQFSVSLFRKDIRNFVYMAPFSAPDADGFRTATYLNGDKGNVRGIEVAWQLQMKFLPAPFDALGVMTNYTMTESEAQIASRPGENLPFIGQSEDNGNVALTWERGGFFLRAALNFRSPRLREDEPLGAVEAEDRWVDRHAQLDLTGSYKISSNWEVFGEVLNVTNEPFRVHFGRNSNRLAQFEEYGWSANAGLRWKL